MKLALGMRIYDEDTERFGTIVAMRNDAGNIEILVGFERDITVLENLIFLYKDRKDEALYISDEGDAGYTWENDSAIREITE